MAEDMSTNVETEEKVEEVSQQDNRLYCVHFTHNDADAMGCAIVQAYNTKYNTVTIFCSYDDVERKIREFFQNPENLIPNFILITDLIIGEDTAQMLENIQNHYRVHSNHEMRLLLVDHHITNTLMDRHQEWCVITSIGPDDRPISAAKLLLHVLRAEINPHYVPILTTLTEKISRYDTWEWKRNPSEKMDEEYFNILVKELGIEEAGNEIISTMTPQNLTYSERAQHIINNYIATREEAIRRIMKQVALTNLFEYKVGIIIPDPRYFNECLEAVYLTYPEVDISIGLGVTNRALSFRSNKTDLNLGRFAREHFGGGGHQQASGARADIDDFLEMLKIYYETLEEQNENEEIQKNQEPVMKYDLHTANDHILEAITLCKDRKLANESLVYVDLINEHLRPVLNDILAENNYDISKMATAFARAILQDIYLEHETIREEINATYGSNDAFLNQFYLVKIDENGNPIDDHPGEEPEVITEDDEIVDVGESEIMGDKHEEMDFADAIIDESFDSEHDSTVEDSDRDRVPEEGILYEDLFGKASETTDGVEPSEEEEK